MGLLRFLVWTACAMGLGIFLASAEVEGRTPLEHMQRAWKRHTQPSALERVKGGLRSAIDDAEEALEGPKQSVKRLSAAKKPERPATPPREQLTAEDRAALDRILSRQR